MKYYSQEELEENSIHSTDDYSEAVWKEKERSRDQQMDDSLLRLTRNLDHRTTPAEFSEDGDDNDDEDENENDGKEPQFQFRSHYNLYDVEDDNEEDELDDVVARHELSDVSGMRDMGRSNNREYDLDSLEHPDLSNKKRHRVGANHATHVSTSPGVNSLTSPKLGSNSKLELSTKKSGLHSRAANGDPLLHSLETRKQHVQAEDPYLHNLDRVVAENNYFKFATRLIQSLPDDD